jgi:hypothetical protein
MKYIIAIFSLTTLFSCSNSKSEPGSNSSIDSAKNTAAGMTNGATNSTAPASTAKKYESKSGIVTYETTASVSGMTIKTKQILYFDDYGVKECQEEYKMDDATGSYVLDKMDFVKDGFRYIISPADKTGLKTKEQGTGVAAKFDMDEAAALKDNQFKKIADETVCGKSCNGFSMVTSSGNIKMYGWNKIALKTVTDFPAMKMSTTTIATKFEENVAVPADKFEIPKDVKLSDY